MCRRRSNHSLVIRKTAASVFHTLLISHSFLSLPLPRGWGEGVLGSVNGGFSAAHPQRMTEELKG